MTKNDVSINISIDVSVGGGCDYFFYLSFMKRGRGVE